MRFEIHLRDSITSWILVGLTPSILHFCLSTDLQVFHHLDSRSFACLGGDENIQANMYITLTELTWRVQVYECFSAVYMSRSPLFLLPPTIMVHRQASFWTIVALLPELKSLLDQHVHVLEATMLDLPSSLAKCAGEKIGWSSKLLFHLDMLPELTCVTLSSNTSRHSDGNAM